MCMQSDPLGERGVYFTHIHIDYINNTLFFRYYETSAATGQGVHEMFSGVLAAVVEAKLVKAKPVISTEQSSSKQKWIMTKIIYSDVTFCSWLSPCGHPVIMGICYYEQNADPRQKRFAWKWLLLLQTLTNITDTKKRPECVCYNESWL